MDFVSDKHAVN